METDGEHSPYRLILLLSLPTIWHKRYGCNVETVVEKYPQKMRFLTRELALCTDPYERKTKYKINKPTFYRELLQTM